MKRIRNSLKPASPDDLFKSEETRDIPVVAVVLSIGSALPNPFGTRFSLRSLHTPQKYHTSVCGAKIFK